MPSVPNSNVNYEYGTKSGSLITPLGGIESGSFDTQGNIRMAVAMSKVGAPSAGSSLTAINGVTQLNVGGAGTLFTGEDSTSSGSYTVRAQDGACTPIPLPVTGTATYIRGGMTFSPNYAT